MVYKSNSFGLESPSPVVQSVFSPERDEAHRESEGQQNLTQDNYRQLGPGHTHFLSDRWRQQW